jgi:hypothetical protein
MRRLVPLVLVAVAAVAASAPAAAPSCRLVRDPRGDGRWFTSYTPTPADGLDADSDLDIVSADIATDAKQITAVVRTVTLRADDPQAPTGRSYWVLFVVGEQRYYIEAVTAAVGNDTGEVFRETSRTPDEPTGAGESSAEGLGRAAVRFDHAKAEVRMTAPLSYFASHTPLSKGRQIRGIEAMSFHQQGFGAGRQSLPNGSVVDWGGGGAANGIDVATTKQTYTVGAPSCVVVGR